MLAGNDRFNKAKSEGGGGMHLRAEDTAKLIKKGEIFGEMTYTDGSVEHFHTHLGQDELNEFVENLIVDRASILIAEHMKGGATDGITYLAVGEGVGTGTLQNPEPANAGATSLRSELTRKVVQITYYDTTNSTGSTITDGNGRSNVLDISVEFLESEAVGALTEMGLFGGTATATINSGDMVNFKTFPVWNKPNNATLRWTWRLTF